MYIYKNKTSTDKVEKQITLKNPDDYPDFKHAVKLHGKRKAFKLIE